MNTFLLNHLQFVNYVIQKYLSGFCFNDSDYFERTKKFPKLNAAKFYHLNMYESEKSIKHYIQRFILFVKCMSANEKPTLNMHTYTLSYCKQLWCVHLNWRVNRVYFVNGLLQMMFSDAYMIACICVYVIWNVMCYLFVWISFVCDLQMMNSFGEWTQTAKKTRQTKQNQNKTITLTRECTNQHQKKEREKMG